jgi:SAM-dependent methyltransferase
LTDPRYERERAFHNQQTNRWESVSKFYRVTASSQGFYSGLLKSHAVGGRVLEYGCGEGSNGFELAELGAEVVGIDISDGRIARARDAAAGVTGQLSFMVMNAEELEFDDDTFDLICGTGILHHLDLNRAYGEIARTLKPSGAAVFLEPLGHNPLINLYRRLTPGFRTDDEHPLRTADLEGARGFFGRAEFHFFHLTSLASVPLGRTSAFGPVLRLLERFDRQLFATVPFLSRYAWTTVMVLGDPQLRSRGLPERTAAASV